MSISKSNRPGQRWPRWRWRWVIPAALLPGAIVNVRNPYQYPGVRIVAWVLLAIIVIMLGFALYANYRERQWRDASNG
jgi:hypothetical protein